MYNSCDDIAISQYLRGIFQIIIFNFAITRSASYNTGTTNNKLDMLVAYFPTATLTTQHLHFTILEGVIMLEMRAGVHITGIIGKLQCFCCV